MMMDALSSTEMSVITRDKRRNIPEDAIRKILKLHKSQFLQLYPARYFRISLECVRKPQADDPRQDRQFVCCRGECPQGCSFSPRCWDRVVTGR
jgi:hypothetical protein